MLNPAFLHRSLLAVALAFTLAACDSNDDPGGSGLPGGSGGVGSASVTLSGGVASSFEGSAYALVEDNEFARNISITLLGADLSVLEALGYTGSGMFLDVDFSGITDDGVPILEGTFTVDPDDFEAPIAEAVYFDSLGDFAGAFEATGGTITLLSITDDEVRGSFALTAEPEDGSQATTLQGTFTAEVIEDTSGE